MYLKLKEYIEENDKKSYDLLIKAQKYVNEFEGKNIFPIVNLKTFISNELGSTQKSLEKELFNEIKNSCESLSDIISQKGFKEWFISLFSSQNFLENVIDMIIDTFQEKKISLNIGMIKDKINDFFNGNLNKINNWISCVTMKFNNEEYKKWKNLCISYDKTREKIIELKSEFKK